MTHAWGPTILRHATIIHPAKTEVRWWPHCSGCGSQACIVGGRIYYRATSGHEWTSEEPRCTVPLRSGDER